MKLNNLIKNQQIMFLVSVLLGGFFALWVLGDLSAPILTSIVLAFLFRPMHVYFTKIGVPERLSVFITFSIAVLLATSILSYFYTSFCK
jgi:predicted PurR-regulated permease PerM